MRQSSTCMPWEPVRCSTYSRSNPTYDASEQKDESSHDPTKGASKCFIRPIARQISSWIGSDAASTSGRNGLVPQPPRSKSYSGDAIASDKSAAPALLDSHDIDNRTTATKASSVSNPLAEHTEVFNDSLESFRTLPSRPKNNSGLAQYKQLHHSVEENRLHDASNPLTQAANCTTLNINRPTSSVEVNVARSRCHPRRRPCGDALPVATPKLRRDTDCTDAIVRLIVFFSTKLVHTIWSQAAATPKTSKDFNGAGVLPLQVFIQETLRRSKTSYSTLQVALFYLILLRPHVMPCQATQQQYTPGCRALQCGRRMFLTALILASKYLQDRNYSARAWSKISGLPVAEINENERHYLELIKYNLHMSKETFGNWSKVVLSICKASGQGPFSKRPDSPPSSPEGLLYSSEFEQPGSSAWWSHHLVRLNPDMVKNTKATEEYLIGLASNGTFVDSNISLDTPPSSPESLEEMLSDHNSPLVLSVTGNGHALAAENQRSGQSPAPVGSMPSRPLPPNLPTPQTTPRYDSAFTFSRRSSQCDIPCRASVQSGPGVDRNSVQVANLATCPPPKPRFCGGLPATEQPLRENAEPSVASWMSSPESSVSDSASFTTRSRSSSVSSVSSVWSMPANGLRQVENKPVSCVRTESNPVCSAAQPNVRANIGSYSFYHPVANMHSIPEDARACGRSSTNSSKPVSRETSIPRSEPCSNKNKRGDLSEIQIAQLLASLSSQSDSEVKQRTNPAVVGEPNASVSTKLNLGPAKKHKRNRSSKEDGFLQDEIRQFLWNEQNQVDVEDDKRPTTHVEASDKQAQFPLQHWAHAKKPIPNALHNKRIALQHSSFQEQRNASELAADFLRQSVVVD